MPRIPVLLMSPSHPQLGSHRRQGLKFIFTPVFSIHHSVCVLGKECELCSSPKIWGGAQESENKHFLGKLASGKIHRFKNSWTREARNQYYLVLLSTLSYMTGNQRFCSQKRNSVLILINMDSKPSCHLGYLSLWLSFLQFLLLQTSQICLTLLSDDLTPVWFGVFRGVSLSL